MSLSALSQIDLNLLVVLVAVAEEGSVTKAAERLGLSQPAVSNALGRLRTRLRDPLFVKTSTGMEATAYAAAIAPRARSLIEEAGALLIPAGEFDAQASKRRFQIGTSDYVASFLVAPLAKRLQQHAPDIEFIVKNANHLNAFELIDRGDIELAITGRLANIPPRMQHSTFMTERLVCAARQDHPIFTGELTVERYLALKHVVFSPWGQIGDGHVDQYLRRHGQRRNITFSVAHFMEIASTLQATDLVVTAPTRGIAPLLGPWGLAIRELPFELAPITMSLVWPRRVGLDSGHAWLRSFLESTREAMSLD